jgi:hypothetical protein
MVEVVAEVAPRHPEDAVIRVGTAATTEAATAAKAATTAATAATTTTIAATIATTRAACGATLERGAQLRRPLTTGVAPVTAPLELA